MAGLLAHLTLCGLPVAMNRNSGRDYKKFLPRFTAAGTAPVSHRIPFSSKFREGKTLEPAIMLQL